MELAEGGKKVKEKKNRRKKEKKSLKKTELAKLYFKVGWHIRGTSSYSGAFFKGYIRSYCSIQKEHSL